jgi:cell division protein FtsW (lipid II flippase)
MSWISLWLQITPTEFFTVVYALFSHCHIMCSKHSCTNNDEKDRGKILGDEDMPYVALMYTFTNRK